MHVTGSVRSLGKYSWKSQKIPSASTTIIFGSSNGTKKFPKPHCVTRSDIIYFSPLAATNPNNFIQSRNVKILRDKPRYGMPPVPQKSINTMPNGVSESIVWIIFCDSWEHEFTNWKCAQDLMKWETYLLTTGHKNCASILNKVLCSWMCPTSGDTWHSDIPTCMNLRGINIRLSCPTLDVCGV